MKTYRIRNTSGQYWTGSCWGVVAEIFDRDELGALELDEDVIPENFYDNADYDIGWGSEAGEAFARAESA